MFQHPYKSLRYRSRSSRRKRRRHSSSSSADSKESRRKPVILWFHMYFLKGLRRHFGLEKREKWNRLVGTYECFEDASASHCTAFSIHWVYIQFSTYDGWHPKVSASTKKDNPDAARLSTALTTAVMKAKEMSVSVDLIGFLWNLIYYTTLT